MSSKKTKKNLLSRAISFLRPDHDRDPDHDLPPATEPQSLNVPSQPDAQPAKPHPEPTESQQNQPPSLHPVPPAKAPPSRPDGPLPIPPAKPPASLSSPDPRTLAKPVKVIKGRPYPLGAPAAAAHAQDEKPSEALAAKELELRSYHQQLKQAYHNSVVILADKAKQLDILADALQAYYAHAQHLSSSAASLPDVASAPPSTTSSSNLTSQSERFDAKIPPITDPHLSRTSFELTKHILRLKALEKSFSAAQPDLPGVALPDTIDNSVALAAEREEFSRRTEEILSNISERERVLREKEGQIGALLESQSGERSAPRGDADEAFYLHIQKVQLDAREQDVQRAQARLSAQESHLVQKETTLEKQRETLNALAALLSNRERDLEEHRRRLKLTAVNLRNEILSNSSSSSSSSSSPAPDQPPPDLAAENQHLRSKIAALQAREPSLTSELQLTHQHEEETRKRLVLEQAHSAELQQQQAALQQQLADADAVRKSTEEHLAMQMQRIQSIHASFTQKIDSFQKFNQSLMEKDAERAKQLAILEQEAAANSASLDAARKENARLSEELLQARGAHPPAAAAAAAASVLPLQKQIEELSDALAQQSSKASQLELRNTDLASQLDLLAQKLAHTEEQLAGAEKQLSLLRAAPQQPPASPSAGLLGVPSSALDSLGITPPREPSAKLAALTSLFQQQPHQPELKRPASMSLKPSQLRASDSRDDLPSSSFSASSTSSSTSYKSSTRFTPSKLPTSSNFQPPPGTDFGKGITSLRNESNPLIADFVQRQPESLNILGGVFSLSPHASPLVVAKKLAPFEGLNIDAFSAGGSHALAVLTDHSLWAKGSSDEGQLIGRAPLPKWTRINNLLPPAVGTILSVSCGAAFSALVTEKGKVYTWGRNADSQCGQRGGSSASAVPRVVVGLLDRIITQVSCGARHMVARSNIGELYSWGHGGDGALGLGHLEDSPTPQRVLRLRNAPVVRIECGAHHTVAMCVSGSLFAWGRYLGPSAAPQPTPLLIEQLQRAFVSEIACGGSLTAVRTIDGQVWVLGSLDNASPPSSPASEPFRRILAGTPIFKLAINAHGIYALGYEANVIVVKPNDAIVPLKISFPVSDTQLYVPCIFAGRKSLYLFATSLEQYSASAISRNRERDVLSYPAFLRGWIGPGRPLPHLSYSMLRSAPNSKELRALIEVVFSKPRLLNASFLKPEQYPVDPLGSINFPALKNSLEIICFRLEGGSEALQRGIRSLIPSLQVKYADQGLSPEELRLWMILPMIPILLRSSRELLAEICEAYAGLPPAHRALILGWLSNYDAEDFHQMVVFFQAALSMSVPTGSELRPITFQILEIVSTLFTLSQQKSPPLLPLHNFANKDLSDREIRHINQDWLRWFATLGSPESLLRWPFALDSRFKLCYLDHALRHDLPAPEASTPRPEHDPFIFLLTVDRANIFQSVLSVLLHWTPSSGHHLKIKYVGEPGIDEGGLSKEFFQLFFEEVHAAQLFYVPSAESHVSWFSMDATSPQQLAIFEAIGLLCALAILSKVVVPLVLPVFLWHQILKKHSGEPLTAGLSDLYEIDPVVTNSLQLLLSSPVEDLEDVFMLSFMYHQHELIPGGGATIVNGTNREQYVSLYCDFMLNQGVAAQFTAFANGFLRVCNNPALKSILPFQLAELVCGSTSQTLDFHDLEESTIYSGGYSSTSETVTRFWLCVHQMDTRMKRLLLSFITGSNRAPVGGITALRLVIRRSDQISALPSSSTCYNTLHLPDYPDQATLDSKLFLAIENCRGFGLA